ncbi:MAG: HAD-IA family hydrolase [candidate division Zixibacteria bacterium]|nr:HAD-IA family hydrolase [candidate division Zixibacteria bacterium]
MGLLTEKKAALFDLGSTLIEYENISWNDVYKLSIMEGFKLLEGHNFLFSEKSKLMEGFVSVVNEMIAHSMEIQKEPDLRRFFIDFFKKHEHDLSDEIYDDFLEHYYQPIRDHLSLIPGAIDVLHFFKSKGCKLGLISNTVFPQRYHYEDMQNFGVLEFFDEIVFSSEFEYRKPHPAIFEHVLRKLDISADQAFFVGDRVDVDVAGAKNAGITAILKLKSDRVYENHGKADLIIDDLAELIENY